MWIKAAAQTLLNARQEIEEKTGPVLDALKDKSIPLDDRWEVYTKLVEANVLVKDASYGDGYLEDLDYNHMSLYDDFYTDRGASLRFIDMYERMTENPEDFTEQARANLPKWQERVLESGYSSFTYDW